MTESGSLPAAGQFVDSQMEVPNRVEFRRNNVRRIFSSGDSPLDLEQIITPGSKVFLAKIFLAEKNRRGVGLTGGQRDNAGSTRALDLDLLAKAIRDE